MFARFDVLFCVYITRCVSSFNFVSIESYFSFLPLSLLENLSDFRENARDTSYEKRFSQLKLFFSFFFLLFFRKLSAENSRFNFCSSNLRKVYYNEFPGRWRFTRNSVFQAMAEALSFHREESTIASVRDSYARGKPFRPLIAAKETPFGEIFTRPCRGKNYAILSRWPHRVICKNDEVGRVVFSLFRSRKNHTCIRDDVGR